jgi:hypothetical protein
MKYLIKPLAFFGLIVLVFAVWWWQYGSTYPWRLGWSLVSRPARINSGDQTTSEWTSEQLAASLAHPDLTTKEGIRDWLRDMRGEGWLSFNVDVSWGKPADQDAEAFLNATRAGTDPTKVGSYTTVWGIRGKTTSISVKQIEVFFYFDKDGKLLNHYVEERTLMP